jgi:arsenate reductase (thioredoxin)
MLDAAETRVRPKRRALFLCKGTSYRRQRAAAGGNMSTQPAKSLDAGPRLACDDVVTVGRDAPESCPVFPGRARIIPCGVDDPPRLAATAPSTEDALRHYARGRDEINAFIEQRPEALLPAKGEPR